MATNHPPRKRGLWTAILGGTTSFDADPNTGSPGLNARSYGFAVGLDSQIDSSTLVGISGGYTNSRFSVDQQQTSGTVEGAHVGLYAVKSLGPAYLATTAEYDHFYNKTDRLINFVVDERARGQFTSDEFSARLEAGWRRAFGNHPLTPFAGLAVAYYESGSFIEDSNRVLGGPGILGLTFGPSSETSLVSSLGIQLDTRVDLANGQTLTPFARVAWAHEFNPERGLNASLTSSPAVSFSPEAPLVASDVAKVNAGLKLDATGNIGLFAVFDGEFSDHSQNYAGNAGDKITW